MAIPDIDYKHLSLNDILSKTTVTNSSWSIAIDRIYLLLRMSRCHYHMPVFQNSSCLVPIVHDCSNRKKLRTRIHERSWLTAIVIRGMETPVFSRIQIELPTLLANAAHSQAAFMIAWNIWWSRVINHWIRNDRRVLLVKYRRKR